jgi:hypothetical protein
MAAPRDASVAIAVRRARTKLHNAQAAAWKAFASLAA